MEEATARTYETTFIVRTSLSDLEVDELVARMKALVEENGCETLKVDLWGRRRLAYRIGRDQDGVYAFMVFRGSPDAVPTLERAFRINENVLRYLTVRCETPVDEIDEIKAQLDDRPASDRSRRERAAYSSRRPQDSTERYRADRSPRADRSEDAPQPEDAERAEESDENAENAEPVENPQEAESDDQSEE